MGLNKLNHNFSYPLKESSADIDALKAGTVQAGATTVVAGTTKADMVQYKSAAGAVMAKVGYDGSISSPNLQFAGKNFAYNGGMDIWQRGDGPWTTGGYYADRWTSTFNTGPDVGFFASYRVSKSVDVPSAQFANSIEYTAFNSVPTGLGEWAARQTYDLQSVRPLAGKHVTASFWYKSNIVGPHAIRIGNTFGVGQSGGADQNIEFTVNVADTWEFKSVVFTNFLDVTNWGVISPTSFATFLDLGFRTGNAAGQKALYTNGYFRFTGVQLEIGTVPTPFTRMGGNYAGEEMLAMRYYESNYPNGRPVGAATLESSSATYGYAINSNRIIMPGGYKYTVPKRIAPTVTIYDYNSNPNKTSPFDSTASVGTTVTVTPNRNNRYGFGLISDSGNGFSGGSYYWIGFTADAEI